MQLGQIRGEKKGKVGEMRQISSNRYPQRIVRGPFVSGSLEQYLSKVTSSVPVSPCSITLTWQAIWIPSESTKMAM
jgi:hypothetical protein